MGYRKLGRTSDQRKAMLRDLATSLSLVSALKLQKLVQKKFVVLLRN